MVIWWLCWHRTIFIRNITQKPYSQFPPVHDFGKPWWGVAYAPCMTNLRALCAWVIWWHVTCMLSLAEHWQGRRALSNHVCAHSVISMWHVVCLQHLARACSEQSRSTTVLPINHVIQMPQCLSGFVNHDYCILAAEGRLRCGKPLPQLAIREDAIFFFKIGQKSYFLPIKTQKLILTLEWYYRSLYCRSNAMIFKKWPIWKRYHLLPP